MFRRNRSNGDQTPIKPAGQTLIIGGNGQRPEVGRNGHKAPAAAASRALDLLGGTQPIIHLQGITKAYETAAGPFVALRDIDLQVYPGEFVAVVGKSGSGKSTLINMFTGIDHPTAGDVHVAGTHIRQLDEGQMAEWRGRHLGIVFQFFQLLPMLTIVENVMLPMDLCDIYHPAERRDRAIEWLSQVGISEDAYKFPSAVSGGQQQRAAIARALANDPAILVADEPTGNLDSKAAETIFELFESLVEQGKTILMVTHDEELAGRVPRVVTLADGEIVEDLVNGPAGISVAPWSWNPEAVSNLYAPSPRLGRLAADPGD